MSTEDKRRRLRRLVPSWSFLTRLRRPYLFSCAGKDREEKSAWTRLVRAASEFRLEPIFQASFHTRLTSRVSDYAPPDTGVSNLQLVALEQLPSIEGEGRICRSAPFRVGVLLFCMHPRLPFQGSWRRRRLRGCLFPARPLRPGFAGPPPLKGEASSDRFLTNP